MSRPILGTGFCEKCQYTIPWYHYGLCRRCYPDRPEFKAAGPVERDSAEPEPDPKP